MLASLSLSNVALIKKQTIDFKNGFNCLLGQSGAGKSIIMDALSFSLGAKADKTLIRSGETTMRVDAVFVELSEEEIKLLNEWEIDYEGELIISRTLSVDGKSSVKFNGFPVTAKMLKEFSERLADFCGQHDSVGLLNVNSHLSLLDKFIGKEADEIKAEVETLYDEVKETEKKISSLGGSEGEREKLKDLLEFQVKEIESAELQVGEEEELKERFEFISSAEKIFEVVGDVLNKLDEQNGNVTAMLYESKNELSSLSNFKDIDSCRERLENCYYEVKDVAEVLEDVKRNTDFDSREMERIDARLDLIKKLSKKYGRTIENILEYKDKIKLQLEELENSQQTLEELQTALAGQKEKLQIACQKLSVLRKKYAELFEKQIMRELEDLQMKGTYFTVNFEETDATRNGFDGVKFMFSANIGQEARDLHKTASGGELSRLLLAFKNVMLEKDPVQTIIFDEIDSGISGHTAGKLAEKLVNISKFTQIICITHTPVVASRANEFLFVEKQVIDGNTISTVKTLSGDEVVREVARLIDGGIDASTTAIEHAKNLLAGCEG